MCVVCFTPPNIKVRKKLLKECFNNNPDGIGFAYCAPDGSETIIKKGYFSFRKFWFDYREVQELNTPTLIHFRIATSGQIDEENCHPWMIDRNHALVHNGVLEHKIGWKSDDTSDTGLFTKHFLKPIFESNPNLWLQPSFKWLLEESIGLTNKIVILRNDGEFRIFNEKAGEWFEGTWFSNKSFKEKRVRSGVKYTPAKSNYTLPTPNSAPKVPMYSPMLGLPAPKKEDLTKFSPKTRLAFLHPDPEPTGLETLDHSLLF